MNEEQLKKWIKKCEGYNSHTYLDTLGHVTIGYGRNLENGINPDEGELMFENDYKRAKKELEQHEWYLIQPDGVQKALINMNFNLGINKLLGFKKMINALKAKKYTVASLEALDSRWATQVHGRANDIALMIRQGK